MHAEEPLYNTLRTIKDCCVEVSLFGGYFTCLAILLNPQLQSVIEMFQLFGEFAIGCSTVVGSCMYC